MNRIAMMVLKNIHAVPGLWVKLCQHAKNPDNYPEIERWLHIQKIMNRALKGGNVELTVTGKENIPEKDGLLLVSNHQGLFDVVALVTAWDKILCCVYKIELKDLPLIKQIAASTKSYAMDRDDVRQSLTVIQGCTEQLKAGRNVLIFPEGTRSKLGNVMGEFHGGSFKCAVKAKADILPFAVIDTYKVLDQKGSGPIACQLHYLKPIPYEEYAGMKTTEIAALVKARIQECIDKNT
jgi:1-acyl-sn-glycerol-3-phosphate acyltransferase